MKYLDRRRFLKIGSTVPVLTTPVVTSIILPVHAQTSSAILSDITPTPSGFVFCQTSSSASIPEITVVIENSGSSAITITAIGVTADIGSSTWTTSVPLPASLDPNESLNVVFGSSPEFSCTSSQNPVLTATYETSNGSITLVHDF